jgi:Domain of unknown function (DUF1707)
VGAEGGPGPAGQPARQPRAPVGDADRDRLLQLLREHYARGNLDDAELELRIGLILSARYTDETAVAVAGLPLLTGQEPAPRRGRSRRRHAQADRPGVGWVPTSERFRDPTSRMIMRVWIDPADDSRHYVPEPPSA